jgi:hypothetical protein
VPGRVVLPTTSELGDVYCGAFGSSSKLNFMKISQKLDMVVRHTLFPICSYVNRCERSRE